MTQNPKLLALGLAGGYLLGRTKKGKLALAAASFVLGRRKGLNPQQLLVEGLKKLSENPEFARLEQQLRGELMSAGKSMISAAANRRIDSLSDALRTRTDALSGLETGAEPEEEPEEEEPEEEPEDEGTAEGVDEEEPEEEPPARKAPPKKKAAKKAPPAKKTAPKKAAAEKGTAKKTASQKTAAEKSTTRKAATKKSASRSTGRR